MGRDPFTGYDTDSNGDVEEFMMADLSLDSEKVRAHINALDLHPGLSIFRDDIMRFRQHYVHNIIFNEQEGGYKYHDGPFAPYWEVVEGINKIRTDLGTKLRLITARSDHLTNIDAYTQKFVDAAFPGIPHYSEQTDGEFWARTVSSGDKPKYMSGVKLWKDDDFRNKKLESYLLQEGIGVIRRDMPFNRHCKSLLTIMNPEDPKEVRNVMGVVYDMIRVSLKTNDPIEVMASDIDDTLRPFRVHMGPSTKLFGERYSDLIEQLR